MAPREVLKKMPSGSWGASARERVASCCNKGCLGLHAARWFLAFWETVLCADAGGRTSWHSLGVGPAPHFLPSRDLVPKHSSSPLFSVSEPKTVPGPRQFCAEFGDVLLPSLSRRVPKLTERL